MHYAALRQPTDPTSYRDLQRLREALDRCRGRSQGTSGGVTITTRYGQRGSACRSSAKLPEPPRTWGLQGGDRRRWGTLDLLDILKETDCSPASRAFTTVATREASPASSSAAGCCWSCSRSAPTWASGSRGHRRPRRDRGGPAPGPALLHHPRQPAGRDHRVVNATFAVRERLVGGRHGLRLGLEEVRRLGRQLHDRVARAIRWPRRDDLLACRAEERCIYSQLKTCSSSEVAAMIEGLLRHCADARDRGQLHRYPRRFHRRVRVHASARLQPAAPAEEHRRRPPLPARPTAAAFPGWPRCSPGRSAGS